LKVLVRNLAQQWGLDHGGRHAVHVRRLRRRWPLPVCSIPLAPPVTTAVRRVVTEVSDPTSAILVEIRLERHLCEPFLSG
jgi:hypothetical protein